MRIANGLNPSDGARLRGAERFPCGWAIGLMISALVWCSVSRRVGADASETSGDVLQFALPVIAAGFTYYNHDGTGGIQLAESLGATMATTFALKYAVNSRRPDGGHHSFPSGHTSISFSSAEYLRKRYGWEYGLPAYGVASWVAYTRVNANRHRPSDVVAGAAIGILSSTLLTRPYKGWDVSLDVQPTYQGISLSRTW